MMDERISKLEAELVEKDEQLYRAGTLGKELLERYQDVCDAMETRAKEHADEIEKLEQEKYALNLKLEQKIFSEKSFGEEVESLKDALRKQREEFELRLDTVNQTELIDLKSKLASVSGELEKAQLGEVQLKDRNRELEGLLEDVQERLKQKINMLNETTSEEMAAMHSEISTLQSDKVAMMRELGDVKDECEQQRLQLQQIQQELQTKTTDMEQQQCQITSYYNALEKARDENKELKAEIDILRMESQDQKKKGNSLFSEVEDRRIVAEKQLITMKVQYESMKKHHEATRQQLQRLKMQIAGLLQMSGRQADSEHMERLETQLMQARGEVDVLTAKLHKLEEEKKSGRFGCNIDIPEQSVHADDKFYIDFLKALVEKKSKELEDQQKQLDSKSFMLIAESDKLMQCERKLYSAEREIHTLQAKCIKLNVKVEELTAKYEPDKLQGGKKVRKTITEKINFTPKDQKENNGTESDTDNVDKEKQQLIIENLQKGGITREKTPAKNPTNASISAASMKKAECSEPTETRNKEENNIKDASKFCDEKQPNMKRTLKTVENKAEEKPAAIELKSVKVRKVTIDDEDDVISIPREQSFDTKQGKTQHKKVKVSEQPQHECQTQ